MSDDDKKPAADFDLTEGEDVPEGLKRLYLRDRDKADQWRNDAREDFDFAAGRQYTEAELKALAAKKRPSPIFNRIGTVLDAVVGYEIGNRRDVRYIPREMGDVKADELLTSAGQWFNQEGQGDFAESAMFLDMLICGMGWTEARIDYSKSPEGEPCIDHIDPIEMVWDRDARQRNLQDAKRVWRTRRIPISEARQLFPDVEDADLDATWSNVTSEADLKRDVSGSDPSNGAQGSYVTIVQCQYIDREPFYLAQDPMTGKEAEFSEKEFATANKRLKQVAGMEMQGVRFRKEVRKQAFLGGIVLGYGKAPAQSEFSYQCVTGKYDRNKGTWYGMVRAMKDPQRWANKWLAQMMFIMNANSKGGLMVENQAIGNIRELEAKWAEADSIIELEDGAISGQRIKERGQAQFPSGFQQLTEFAITSIRDVSGVSVEMMGLREGDQPASLELQRRQAGMNILQWAFDGLKLYAQLNGRLILDYLQHDLSDNRLIRIVGKESEQYVPLMKQATEEYDIIVDESPTSPNQKEMIWATLGNILPSLGKILPPNFIIKLLKFSPFPSSITDELDQMANAQTPEAQQAAAMKARAAAAQIDKTASEAMLNKARAQEAMQPGQADAGNSPQAMTMQASLEWRKAVLDALTKLQVAKIGAKTANESAQIDAELEAMLGMHGMLNERLMQGRQQAHEQALTAMQPQPLVAA